jgi:hypothetical protein
MNTLEIQASSTVVNTKLQSSALELEMFDQHIGN